MSADFLLEIGCEEIPSRYMEGALHQLKELTWGLLEEYRLKAERVDTWGTPRRLVLFMGCLESHQNDLTVKIKGPPCNRAYNKDGSPTAAVQGFARSQGVPIDQIKTENIKGSDYTVVCKLLPGKPVQQILPELLLKAISGLNFPRTMYWRSREIRFVRPVRWLLALYGSEIIPFSFGETVSGRRTFGHRYLSSGPFAVKDPPDYFRRLGENYVILDQCRRREMIRDQVQGAARSIGGRAVLDEGLLEEVCYLVEYPVAVSGEFSPEYLLLPPEVLITSMRVHQRYFPVMELSGQALLPNFIGISNHRLLENTCLGYEKVLEARLSDARFFFEEDQKVPLEGYVSDLAKVIFQESLGSLDEKRCRLLDLTGYLCSALGLSALQQQAVERVAHLCKADLVTLMVKEFPELQGIMGREYARLSGEEEGVARGIYEHYLPRYGGDELPQSLAGALVSLADRLDTLAGCFAIGIQPTGSQDPYGLRRQAQGMAAVLLEHKIEIPLPAMLEKALSGPAARASLAPDQYKVVLNSLREFVQGRINFILREKGLSSEVIAAATAVPLGSLVELYKRAAALEHNQNSSVLLDIVTTYHRVANLAKKAPGKEVNPARLGEEAEQRLYRLQLEIGEGVKRELSARNYDKGLALLQELKEPVDRFFDKVLVMTECQHERENRLNLLASVKGLFDRMADFSLLMELTGRNHIG